jgi:hypothetical protein
MKPNAPSFERLAQAATIIAQHADYSGKQEAVAECLDDVENRWTRGLLTLEQRFKLCAILVRGTVLRRDRPQTTTV